MNRMYLVLLGTAALMLAGGSQAAPADLTSSLAGVSGLLNVAVQNAGVAEKPINGVLKGAGLSPCDNTVELTKYVGTCIPAHLKCVGVNVLDVVTKKLVNIPPCGGEDPAAAAATAAAGANAVAQSQVQTQSLLLH